MGGLGANPCTGGMLSLIRWILLKNFLKHFFKKAFMVSILVKYIFQKS